jgi:hypothetical protein
MFISYWRRLSIETGKILRWYAKGGCDGGLAITFMPEMAAHHHFFASDLFCIAA